MCLLNKGTKTDLQYKKTDILIRILLVAGDKFRKQNNQERFKILPRYEQRRKNLSKIPPQHKVRMRNLSQILPLYEERRPSQDTSTV